MTSTQPPWEPPMAGSEAEHLAGALDRLRWTFRWKSDGLDRAGLATGIASSSLTLGGLLKHLAVVEDATFSWKLAGEAPVTWLAAPEGGAEQWQWTVTADDTPTSLYELWDQAVGRSRARWAQALSEGGLDQVAHISDDEGRHPSMRRLIFDLIEEYGRHAGHADLLREAVDGRVREDPPAHWHPSEMSSR
ncbi:MAG: DUF664 domain-containing protein [Ornithinimicrobium sp.]